MAKGLAVGLAVVTVLSALFVVAGAPSSARPPVALPSVDRPEAIAPVQPAIASPDLGWQTPVPLETQTPSSANLAGIAQSADGTGMIVWQREGALDTLMATHFLPNSAGDAGTDWQVPVQISTGENSIGYTYNGAVGMDSAGDAMAVYYEWNGDGHGYTIYAVYFEHGVGWKTPVAIDQSFGDSYDPVVAMNAFGDAVVVWYVWTGSTYSVYSNHYVPGSGWATAVEVSATTNYSYDPTVAIDGSGNAIAAWVQNDGGNLHVYAARYATTSGWGAPLLAETSTDYAYGAEVAMDPEGNGIVAWEEYDGQFNVWAKLYVNTSGWQTATDVKGNTYYAGYAAPSVTINEGNATVVWSNANSGGTEQVYINRYVSGKGWAGEVDISGTGSPAYGGDVAMDPTGNITVTYQYAPPGTTPANEVVNEAARYDQATSTWSYTQLDDERVGDGAPLVAIDGQGNALSVWTYNDNGSGTPRNGLLTNYYASATGWELYYDAQQADWDSDLQPAWLQLESNAKGDAIFSFTQDDGPIWQGYAALYNPATGWGPVTRIENMTYSSVAEEWSAIDGAGNAIVLFKTSNATQYNIYATYYAVGSGWGTPIRLDNAAGSNKFWLRVALNDEGNGVAAWEEYNGTNWNNYAAFFNGTTRTWSAPSEVQSTLSYVGSDVVGIDGRGDVMTVYEAWNGSAYNNYASLYKVGVGWEAPVQISTNGTNPGEAYALTMNDAGYAAVSWGQTSGNVSVAAVNVYSPTTGWGKDTTFVSGSGDEGPGIPSLDGAGDALLAYDSWNGTQWIAYAVTKAAGGSWGTPVQLSSGSGDATGLTSALDYQGTGYVAWTQYNGAGYDIVSRKYTSGVGWGAPETVNQPAPATPASDTGSPILGTDGHGDAILGWNQWDDGALLPYAAEYIAGTGAPSLTVTAPANGSLTNHNSVTVAGTTDPGATVTIDGGAVAVALNGSFSATYSLADGTHTFEIVATNGAGDSTSAATTVTVETTPPSLAITSPLAGTTVTVPTVVVTGTAEVGTTLVINGYAVAVTSAGTFSVELPLTPGANTIIATDTDPAGNSATRTLTVTYSNPVPAAQSSITSLTAMNELLLGLVVAALAVGVASLFLRARRPPGPMGPPKEVAPPPYAEGPPKP